MGRSGEGGRWIRWWRYDTNREMGRRGAAMNWLSGLFRRRKREKELEEEVRSHLEMAARERVEKGEEKKEAERAARRGCGNGRLVKERRGGCWGPRGLGAAADS